ncbi:Aldolase-type TIM barrel family protein [Trifolium repens]|nr:Aldolase-type TIM barrel family protein [Trifolium repens]
MFDDLCPIELRFDAPVKKFLATEESYANPIYERKSVMKLSTADRHVYLAGQDGLEHHIVSSKHRSEFHPIKVKPTSQLLAIQRLMMWYIFRENDTTLFWYSRQIYMTTAQDLESMMMDVGQGVGFIKDFVCW